MTQTRQDTEAVHLLDDDDQALCGIERPRYSLNATVWAAGLAPAGLGIGICRACQDDQMPELRDAEDMGP